MTFSGKWSTLKDANVKNQVRLHLIFDVNVIQCTPIPGKRHEWSSLIGVNFRNREQTFYLIFDANVLRSTPLLEKVKIVLYHRKWYAIQLLY